MDIDRFRINPGSKISLKKIATDHTEGVKNKDHARTLLQRGIAQLAHQQALLYAQNNYALLVVLQAMDAAGKDSTIKNVLSGVNPQGISVTSFKAPSDLERSHGFLWRSIGALPRRGMISIHNRSHYEEVLITRVHPEILERQLLPPALKSGNILKRRFEHINNWEHYLVDNGTLVLKIFLHVSEAEQKRRFIERIQNPDKNWKFSINDAKERVHWKDYRRAYEDVLRHTSSAWAPWFVVPADNKWYLQLVVNQIIVRTLKSLNLEFPRVTETHRQELIQVRALLEAEDDIKRMRRQAKKSAGGK